MLREIKIVCTKQIISSQKRKECWDIFWGGKIECDVPFLSVVHCHWAHTETQEEAGTDIWNICSLLPQGSWGIEEDNTLMFLNPRLELLPVHKVIKTVHSLGVTDMLHTHTHTHTQTVSQWLVHSWLISLTNKHLSSLRFETRWSLFSPYKCTYSYTAQSEHWVSIKSYSLLLLLCISSVKCSALTNSQPLIHNSLQFSRGFILFICNSLTTTPLLKLKKVRKLLLRLKIKIRKLKTLCPSLYLCGYFLCVSSLQVTLGLSWLNIKRRCTSPQTVARPGDRWKWTQKRH